MVIDVHCHVGYSARRVRPDVRRFSFEPDGARGAPGFDSYFSPRFLARPAWFFVRRWLGIDPRLGPGDALDARIEAVNELQWADARSVDRFVLLAFDEYYDDTGVCIGPAERRAPRGSDLYVSNSFVRTLCDARPERFLFGASIHPYRPDALDALDEVAAAGAVLMKWLPVHQNIRAGDPRTTAFLRRAAQLGLPMLIHYGGEMSLTRQHPEFESPLEFLETYRALRAEGAAPPTIVAHAATPSFGWQSAAGHRALVSAMIGEFRDAPLYADNSALAAFGRTPWLKRLARQPDAHRKLVWGSDYPIPVMLAAFVWQLGLRRVRALRRLSSWIEQDLQLKRALGFDEAIFKRAAEILPIGRRAVT